MFIPKDNGQKRSPGISTTVLNEHYEDKFPDSSLSSPGRVCHNATDRVLEVAEEGYIYVIDMEQGKFIA